MRENVNLYFTPTEIWEGKTKQKRMIRMGGMVEKGSVIRDKDLKTQFIVTDFAHSVTVKYIGILPDLFKEGQGVVVLGRVDDSQNPFFYAEQVLAKHDENYMPPEVNNALKQEVKNKK